MVGYGYKPTLINLILINNLPFNIKIVILSGTIIYMKQRGMQTRMRRYTLLPFSLLR